MKFLGFDIHLSDKKADKERHEEMKFTEERIKDAKEIAVTGHMLSTNTIYEKNGELYIVPNWCGVYKIGKDLHDLTKVKPWERKKNSTMND